jgi:hypothetical protein
MSRFAGHWAALVAEHGSPRVALLYLAHRVLQRLSGGRVAIVPYLLVAQPVGNPVLAAVKDDPNTVVRRITPDDPVVAEFPRPREVIAQRFADGAECHVAWVKGRFAGTIWIARGRYVEDEVRCVYEIADPATGVWDYDVYVVPDLRLGRTMGRLWKAVDTQLAATGAHWSFSRINRFNPGSVKSHQRLGAVTVGRVVFLVVGGLQLAWLGGWSFGLLASSRRTPHIAVVAPSIPG